MYFHTHPWVLPQVAASSGPRLAVWCLSGVSARIWLVHSSLVLPDGKHITSLDVRSGMITLLSSLPLLTRFRSLGRCNAFSAVGIYLDNGERPPNLVVQVDPKVRYPLTLHLTSLHPWNSSQTISSIYFSPSLVYLAATSEVCARSYHKPLLI